MKVLYDVVYLRSIFLRDKRFLLSLYTNNVAQNKKLISSATQEQLNTVLRILHLIVNNVIKIRLADFDVLRDMKKIKLLQKKIKTKDELIFLLSASETKRKFIFALAATFSILLKPLFEETY
jgi:hypothetical protein